MSVVKDASELVRACSFGPAPPLAAATVSCRSGVSPGGAHGQLSLADSFRRVPESFRDVVALEIREMRQYVVGAHPIGQHSHDGSNGNPEGRPTSPAAL